MLTHKYFGQICREIFTREALRHRGETRMLSIGARWPQLDTLGARAHEYVRAYVLLT